MPINLLSTPRQIPFLRLIPWILGLFAAFIVLLTVFEGLALLYQVSFPLSGVPKPDLFLRNPSASVPRYADFETAFQNRYLFHWKQEGAQASFSSFDRMLEQWGLSGILAGRQRQAIFLDRTTGSTVLVKEGQTFQEAEVKEIGTQAVRLRRGSEEREVSLER